MDLNNDVDSEGCRLSEKIECKGEGRQELKRKDYNFQNVPTLSEQIKNVPTLSEQIKNVPTQSERSVSSRNNYWSENYQVNESRHNITESGTAKNNGQTK